MSFCFLPPSNLGMECWASASPVSSTPQSFPGSFYIMKKKMILLEKTGKKPKSSQFRGEKNQRLPTDETVALYSQGRTNHQTCTEWPPSIFSICGFLQSPIVDSFQPQNRCLALLPFKKELLLFILQCLGYLKLLLP